MRSAINTALFILFLLLSFLTSVSYAADEPFCPIGIVVESKSWSFSQFGSNPYICVRSCRYNTVASVCADTLDSCTSDFKSTGNVCTEPDGMIPGGDIPPEPPIDIYLPSPAVKRALQLLPPNLNTGKEKSQAAYITSMVTGYGVWNLEELNGKIDRLERQVLKPIATNTANMSLSLSKLNTISNSITNVLSPSLDSLVSNTSQLSGLYNYFESTKQEIRNNTSDIVSAINSIDTDGVDNSDLVNVINNHSESVSTGLDSIVDSLSSGSFVQRDFNGKIDFNSLGLYDSTLLDSVLSETEELKEQYQQQVEQFKNIFSFDVSQLNNGQYKEHSLDFVLPDGKPLSLKSGVLPAFLSQANLISAVILFVAALISVKAILGSRK